MDVKRHADRHFKVKIARFHFRENRFIDSIIRSSFIFPGELKNMTVPYIPSLVMRGGVLFGFLHQ